LKTYPIFGKIAQTVAKKSKYQIECPKHVHQTILAQVKSSQKCRQLFGAPQHSA
jgi:hypothetical protein